MKVLVTGAGGFIGSFLCGELVNREMEISALALPGEKVDHLEEQGIGVLRGDLTDPACIKGICDNIDLVFHLAGKVTDWGPRKEFYSLILDATRNLLDESEGRVSRFVYFSSVCACGTGRHLKGQREDDPVFKTGVPYGDAKLDAENLVRERHGKNELACTIIRPTNVTGPGSVWVRDIIDRFLSSKVPLFDGGRHSASLIYVQNLVDGVISAGTLEVAAGRTYHFRDDWDVSWKRYLTDLGDMVGKKPSISFPYWSVKPAASVMETVLTPLNVRPPATRHTLGIMGRDLDIDNTRAKEELGWRTKISYEEAMEKIRDWVLNVYLKQ